MKKALSISLLILGTAIAGSFGARNGADLTERRAIMAIVSRYEMAYGLPESPDSLSAAQVQRLNATQRNKREAEISRLLNAKMTAFQHLVDDGLLGAEPTPPNLNALKPIVSSFLRRAEAERDKTPLPSGGERVQQWLDAGGVGWLFGVFLLGAGALMARKQLSDEAKGVGVDTRAQVNFSDQVDQIIAQVGLIQSQIAELPMQTDSPEARDQLDHVAAHLIMPLVDARGRFQARHGVPLFAGYFSPLSSGERNLNRCWSALTDGHAIVARDALNRALQSFQTALTEWERAEQSADPSS